MINNIYINFLIIKYAQVIKMNANYKNNIEY